MATAVQAKRTRSPAPPSPTPEVVVVGGFAVVEQVAVALEAAATED
jgi:hypothetical protein